MKLAEVVTLFDVKRIYFNEIPCAETMYFNNEQLFLQYHQN